MKSLIVACEAAINDKPSTISRIIMQCLHELHISLNRTEYETNMETMIEYLEMVYKSHLNWTSLDVLCKMYRERYKSRSNTYSNTHHYE